MPTPKFVILSSRPIRQGGYDHSILYWYTVDPPILNHPKAQVAPQTRANLSADASEKLDEAERAALDQGLRGFEVETRRQTANEGDKAFRDRILAEHAVWEAYWVSWQREVYKHSGHAITGP